MTKGLNMDLERLISLIDALVTDYIKDVGHKPHGLVLGPEAYVSLCEYVRRTEKYMADAKVEAFYISEFQGMQIFAKEMPGIEIIIPYTHVWRHLK
jgi:hypothetical protein